MVPVERRQRPRAARPRGLRERAAPRPSRLPGRRWRVRAPKPRREFVFLVAVEQVAGDLGGLAEADGQHAGGQRIEAAGVAGLDAPEGAAHALHRGVRTQAQRLVEQQDAVNHGQDWRLVGRRLRHAASSACAARSKDSSAHEIQARRMPQPDLPPHLAAQEARRPHAGPRAASDAGLVAAKRHEVDSAHDSRSRASSTCVMVTGPTRGSRTSREISSASTRCICASMRCRRLLPEPCVPSVLATSMVRCVRATSTREKHSIWSPGAHVLVVLHADAALGAGTHFARRRP